MDTGEAIFSSELPTAEADALLCEWAPASELFSFPRRKAWYCCEPWPLVGAFHGGTWNQIRAQLAPGEFLCHDHDDPRYRVPHTTHHEPLFVDHSADRQTKAIAVVSNHGGNPWRRHPGIQYRNRFVTNDWVDLYGGEGWKTFRSRWFSSPKPPANYKGPIEGKSPSEDKRKLLGNYLVNVCLENLCTPYYFTEKFVDAVRAGCVPVYRAHPTNVEILAGCLWIDPANHDHDPARTIQAALKADGNAVRSTNEIWMRESTALAASSHFAVYKRIGQILSTTS